MECVSPESVFPEAEFIPLYVQYHEYGRSRESVQNIPSVTAALTGNTSTSTFLYCF